MLPPTTIHHHPPPSTTTHHHSKYIHHHQPEYIRHHSPPPTDNQNFFYKKPIYKNLWPLSEGNLRNLTSRPSVVRKLFLHGPVHYFCYIHKKWFKKAALWTNLSEELRNINSINTFKSSILNFVRPTENSVFEVHDIKCIKLLTRLGLDFSHLNEHKFRHNFNDTINPMCSCGKEPETTLHYLLRCDLYSIYRLELLNDVCALNGSLMDSSEEKLLKILLYGAEENYFWNFKVHNKVS